MAARLLPIPRAGVWSEIAAGRLATAIPNEDVLKGQNIVLHTDPVLADDESIGTFDAAAGAHQIFVDYDSLAPDAFVISQGHHGDAGASSALSSPRPRETKRPTSPRRCASPRN